MRKLTTRASTKSLPTESYYKSLGDQTNSELGEQRLKTVIITIHYYQNVSGLFPISDLRARCAYKDYDLGETQSIPVTDDTKLIVECSFSFGIDDSSLKELNGLLSNPGIISVYQHPGVFDQDIYDQLQPNEKAKDVIKVRSIESIVSVYEAFTGTKMDRTSISTEKKVQRSKSEPVSISEKKKEKPKAEKKEKKGKKSTKTTARTSSSHSLHRSSSSIASVTQKTLYGICIIDFIPLFNGKTSFTETLLIKPTKIYEDERMHPFKNHPQVVITVSVTQPLNIPQNLMVNLTVESIYNLPSVMKSDMDYKVCAVLPVDSMVKEKLFFSNPMYTTQVVSDQFKCWPGMQIMGNNANTTKYKISSNNEEIISKAIETAELLKLMNEGNPRLQYNMLRRHLMFRDGLMEFTTYLKTFRKIVLEIVMVPKVKKTQMSCQAEVHTDDVSSVKRSKIIPNLHMMAILDVSAILYPGATKVRVACQLRTFQPDEIRKYTGITESFFISQPRKDGKDVAQREPKEQLGQKEVIDSKRSKRKLKDRSSTEKSSVTKLTKQHKEETEQDLQKLLPTKPEEFLESEPSAAIYSENGTPCFIVMEIELSQAITEKRTIEDLSEDLNQLLHPKPIGQPVMVLNNCVTKDYYKEVLSEIMKDLNVQYQNFTIGKRQIKSQKLSDFTKYLKTVGAYQTYLSSITKAAHLIVANKFKRIEITVNNGSKEYTNLVEEIFLYLVSKMNDFVNTLVCDSLEPKIRDSLRTDLLFFYAKEAVQLRNIKLADRYFLERLCEDEKNADFWFDYAVFNLEIGDADKAYECVQESLSCKSDHCYSLVMLGAFLASKGQKEEAETCFLNLMVHVPRWLEGWGVLYLFYQKFENTEGMDVALEMARKYINDERKLTTLFEDFEDLLWSSQIIPNTIFFRTAVTLLKLRLYDWAEYACAEEIDKNYGLANYLLSAICYYKGVYAHALEHVNETKEHYGGDYAIFALTGHCLSALGKYKEARKEYYHSLESFNRPATVHLVNINCAYIMQQSGEDQEARKLILISCKYNPTPYTWMKAGELYLQENDLLSAEECFSEGNLRDNRNADLWGYLAIVNSKLFRPFEAEICYNQALKNDLDNEKVLKEIEHESKTWKSHS